MDQGLSTMEAPVLVMGGWSPVPRFQSLKGKRVFIVYPQQDHLQALHHGALLA